MQLAHAAGVDDDVVADLMPHSFASAFERSAAAGAALAAGGSISSSSLPPLREIRPDGVDLGRQQVGRRPGDDERRGVGRHRARLGERQALDVVVVALERAPDGRCSRRAPCWSGRARRGPARSRPSACAPLTTLMMRVGQVLLGVADDALGAALVLERPRCRRTGPAYCRGDAPASGRGRCTRPRPASRRTRTRGSRSRNRAISGPSRRP